MGRGKYKKGPTGRRHFSSPEELAAADAGESAAKDKGTTRRKDVSDSDDDEGDTVKTKGVEGLIEVSNPNVQRKQHVKVSDLEEAAQPELSRREREEIEKQRAKERYWKLHEQGKTEEARKDLERLAIIRKQREEAAKKRAEEKAAKEAAKTRR